MSEIQADLTFDHILADAVERKMGNIVSQNQCAMDVFIALLARQRAAGVNDPVIHITREERIAMMGQTVSFTSYPDGSLKVYTPGSAHAPDATEDWNHQEVLPQTIMIIDGDEDGETASEEPTEEVVAMVDTNPPIPVYGKRE